MANSVTVDHTQLTTFVRTVLLRCGLDEPAATTATEVICYADIHGFTTHGTNALAGIYAPRLRAGSIRPDAQPKVVVETPTTAVIDGDNGLGAVTMVTAVDLAAAKARELGLGMVTVRNSSHFGSAGYYTNRVAADGLVGIVMSNCGAQGVVPPLGGVKRLLGTNPLSAAVPVSHGAPFVLDMSATAVATGKIRAAQREGRPVPEGWLVAADGSTTTDPDAYFAGHADVAWLGGTAQTGGAKGYGLALLVDLLCGPLAGAAYGPRPEALTETEPADDVNIGQVALVINPAAFGVAESFPTETRALLDTVSASPAAPGQRVTYPGAPEAERAAVSYAEGIRLPQHVAVQLVRLGAELDVAVPAALTEAGSA